MRKIPCSEKLNELNILFEKASKEEDKKKQMRIIKKARRYAKHENISIRKFLPKWKNKFCRRCNSFFKVDTVKIRLNRGKISIRCLNCGKVYRKRFK